MRKALAVMVVLVIVFVGIRLVSNRAPVVDPRAEARAYLIRQLDGLECDLSGLTLQVEETDQKAVRVVHLSGPIQCQGTLLVQKKGGDWTVSPIVGEQEALPKSSPKDDPARNEAGVKTTPAEKAVSSGH